MYIFSADCPCENFDCDSIEASNTTVLILYSSSDFSKDQFLLNPDGGKLSFICKCGTAVYSLAVSSSL